MSDRAASHRAISEQPDDLPRLAGTLDALYEGWIEFRRGFPEEVALQAYLFPEHDETLWRRGVALGDAAGHRPECISMPPYAPPWFQWTMMRVAPSVYR